MGVNNPVVSNPNDFKVVRFTNKTDFGFTPEMGCMYDGRPIFGITGAPGVNAGESLTVPYHIGQQLAINLAKVALTKTAPSVDPAGIPTGVPLWDTVKLKSLKESYLADLYTEAKPAAVSQTDLLMAKVEEYKKMVDTLVAGGIPAPVAPVAPQTVPPVVTEPIAPVIAPIAPVVPPVVSGPKVYQDKQEVIAELDKRGIKHDKRKSKADLEKLLA